MGDGRELKVERVEVRCGRRGGKGEGGGKMWRTGNKERREGGEGEKRSV
jgi:hypothetical protein